MFQFEPERMHSRTDQLLYAILQKLETIEVKLNDQQVNLQSPYKDMKRPELMRLYKEKIIDPPIGWTKKTNEEMIQDLLKEG